MKANVLSVLSGLILLSSCAFHSSSISGGSAVITNDQFSSIDFAYGTARTIHVLGVGGNKKDALLLEAKRNLYANYQLSPTQAVGQTTVDFKRTLVFPVLITKVVVSSEIIDFASSPLDTTSMQHNRHSFYNPRSIGINGVEVDYRLKKKVVPATVMRYEEGRYTIAYIDDKNRFKVRRVVSSDLMRPDSSRIAGSTNNQPYPFSETGSLRTPKLPIGELIRFKYKEELYVGELIQISGTAYLIKMENENGQTIGLYIPESDIIK